MSKQLVVRPFRAWTKKAAAGGGEPFRTALVVELYFFRNGPKAAAKGIGGISTS